MSPKARFKFGHVRLEGDHGVRRGITQPPPKPPPPPGGSGGGRGHGIGQGQGGGKGHTPHGHGQATFPPGLLVSALAIVSGGGSHQPQPPPVVSGYRAAVLADLPLAYWKLDEPSGTTMIDSSGNANDGGYGNAGANPPTLNQTPLISTGKSVLMNGTDQEAHWNQVVALSASNKCSFEAWVKTSTVPGAAMMIICHDDNNGGNRFSQFPVTTAGKAQFTLFDTGGSAHTVTGATSVNDGTSRHIVGTYDGTTMLIYVNGVQDGTTTATFTPQTAAGTPFTQIGARFQSVIGFSNFFVGNVDEVALYTTALSAARVAAHYAARN